jgi:phage terminase large subunit-like protein
MAELTAELLAEIEPGERELFLRDFSVFAHSHQLPPDLANNGEPWTTWLILGGRGAGKTRPVRNGFVPWPSAIQRHV